MLVLHYVRKAVTQQFGHMLPQTKETASRTGLLVHRKIKKCALKSSNGHGTMKMQALLTAIGVKNEYKPDSKMLSTVEAVKQLRCGDCAL